MAILLLYAVWGPVRDDWVEEGYFELGDEFIPPVGVVAGAPEEDLMFHVYMNKVEYVVSLSGSVEMECETCCILASSSLRSLKPSARLALNSALDYGDVVALLGAIFVFCGGFACLAGLEIEGIDVSLVQDVLGLAIEGAIMAVGDGSLAVMAVHLN